MDRGDPEVRILYVVHDDLSEPSAASVNTSGRIRALVDLGHEVLLLCVAPPPGLPESVGVSAVGSPRGGFARGAALRTKIAAEAKVCLKRWRPQLMMTRGLVAAPSRLARDAGVAVVAEAHGCLKDEMQAVGVAKWKIMTAMLRERMAVDAVHGVVALDTTTGRRMVELWPSLNGRMRVIPNGVDPSRFPVVGAEERARLRGSFGYDESQTVLVFCGQLWDIYDFGGLFKALKRDATLRLLVAGDGPTRTALESQARALGVDKVCTFLGRVGPDRVREVYAVGDMGVLPNKPEMAGLHLKVFEYAAAGLPLIAPRCDELEFLEREGHAALATGLDGDAIYGAIADALRRRMHAPSERTARREYAAAHFAWPERMREFLDFAQSVAPWLEMA